jgi:hypothetical protein
MLNVSEKTIEIFQKVTEKYKGHGYEVDTIHEFLFHINGLGTGWGAPLSDLNLFQSFSQKNPNICPKIFIVGNAFGFSTLFCSELFPNSSIDVIDNQSEGSSNALGNQITKELSKKYNLDINLTIGSSPVDTPRALRFKEYDFVFIDGLHTNEQVVLDFEAIEPYLSQNSICFFHDVKYCSLYGAISELKNKYSKNYFWSDILPDSETGMVVAYRGINF